ncbi:MAG: PaaI family thioesterase, partial [Novosphingobium sp.]|nr:PaaI family thioesterase [Novosphingobium sp.]
MVIGCRVMPNMCNPMNVAHGGWIATLCDVGLPLTARLTVPDLALNFLLTVNLSVDYLAGAKLGEWVECRSRVLKRTKRLLFVDGLLSVEGGPVARASGVFRIGPNGPEVVF